MKHINLKLFYAYLYKTDTYVEVPDEIVELLKLFDKQSHVANEKRRVNKAYYSLNLNDGIERACMHMTNFTFDCPWFKEFEEIFKKIE